MKVNPGIVIVMAFALLSACSQRSVNVQQEQNALMAVDKEAGESTASTDKFVGAYTDDATLYPQGTPKITGTAGIREFIGKMMAMPGVALRWTPEKAVVSASGEVGYTTGTYKYSGDGMSEDGKYLSVWKKQSDGKWKMTEDIFNADTGMQTEAPPHVMMTPAAVQWGAAPPTLPAGAKVAVLSGDPSKPGPFVMRIQMPAGYRLAAHWHPTDELVTIVSGTLAVGMGDKLDDKAAQPLPAGGFTQMPARMHHYAIARTPTVVQVNAMGPFAIIYVDPADDPGKQAGK